MTKPLMKVHDTNKIYEKMQNERIDKQEHIFRYELMKPFETMWTAINVPIRSSCF